MSFYKIITSKGIKLTGIGNHVRAENSYTASCLIFKKKNFFSNEERFPERGSYGITTEIILAALSRVE